MCGGMYAALGTTPFVAGAWMESLIVMPSGPESVFVEGEARGQRAGWIPRRCVTVSTPFVVMLLTILLAVL